MQKCPFFGMCGGCKCDFTSQNYQSEKLKYLPKIENMCEPIWGIPGTRRRADFNASPNHFGFYKTGTHDIIDITHCPNLVLGINEIIPNLAALPWCGVASVLVTQCENGIVVNVTSDVPYFDSDFNNAVQKLPRQIIRFTWNKTVIRASDVPKIAFDDVLVPFPDNAFLQPTKYTEKIMRDMVVQETNNAKKVADLFCGIGNFTFATHAMGFDISGVGTTRDLFKKPLMTTKLNNFDAIIIDPPRAGAQTQIRNIAKSTVPTVVYISCNPTTWLTDKTILERGGYILQSIIPIDQFVGAAHWEIFSVFKK